MTKLTINTGSSANKGDGDPTRTAWTKANSNFDELYERVETLEDGPGSGTTVTQDIIGSVFADDSTLLVDAVNGTIPGYISLDELKTVVAASSDFSDFQTRIAAL